MLARKTDAGLAQDGPMGQGIEIVLRQSAPESLHRACGIGVLADAAGVHRTESLVGGADVLRGGQFKPFGRLGRIFHRALAIQAEHAGEVLCFGVACLGCGPREEGEFVVILIGLPGQQPQQTHRGPGKPLGGGAA